MKNEKWVIALAAGLGVSAVTYYLLTKKDLPIGAKPVEAFDINRYMGKWHEIARLPNRIEQNVDQLTEQYTKDTYGNMAVITRAYHTKKKEWKEFTGKIKLAGPPNIGMLKVSYFGPFYLAYNILDIDADYQYALVSGSGLDYLWILSRTTNIPDDIKNQFLSTAKNIGFAIDKLEWV